VQVPPFDRSKWGSLERLECVGGGGVSGQRKKKLLLKAEEGVVHGNKI